MAVFIIIRGPPEFWKLSYMRACKKQGIKSRGAMGDVKVSSRFQFEVALFSPRGLVGNEGMSYRDD